MPRSFERMVFVGLAALAAPVVARAYTDPGAGSMLLQLILGGAAGLFVAVRIFKDRLRRFLGFGKHDKQS